MKGLVISVALRDFKTIFGGCLRTHKAYCDRHGYRYLLVDSLPTLLSPSDCSWLKIPLMIHALEAEWDWVMFVDADCEIRSSCPPLDHVEQPAKSVFMAHGFSGRYNAGVIIARCSADSIDFLQAVWKHAEQPVPEGDRAPYENGHVIHFGKQNPAIGVLARTWNNNVAFERDSYIQHYSAGRLRNLFMRRWPVRMRRWFVHVRNRVQTPNPGICASSEDDTRTRLRPAIDHCVAHLDELAS
jgi:hypothetical protein